MQHGFVPGRQAQEALMLAKLAVQKSQEFSRPPAILQLDIKKAFDSVDHSALARALLARGVGGPLVTAILREIRSSKLHISVPGGGDS
eukprot:9189389-Alexandrium_andersonii.AAC.1